VDAVKKIMIYSRDPGAANCVIPVFQCLSKFSKYKIELIGKDFALKKYLDSGLEAKNLSEIITNINYLSVKEFLKNKQYDLIFSGVGSDDLTDRLLWRAAKELSIPTIVILDQWLNYSKRFYFGASNEKIDKSKMVVPNIICVMDDLAKKEMIKEGFDSKILRVTGQPYFELVLKRQTLITKQDKQNILNHLGIKNGSYKIFFVSEPIVEFNKDSNYLGYDQFSILETLLNSLSLILKNDSKLKVDLVIKFHPRNNPDIFSNFIIKYQNIPRLKIILDKISSPDLVLAIADLLVGMSSALLLEAAILGKPFFSLQVGLKCENPFMLSRIGMAKTILTQDELVLSLNNFFGGKINKQNNFDLVRGSVIKIKQVIDNILWSN